MAEEWDFEMPPARASSPAIVERPQLGPHPLTWMELHRAREWLGQGFGLGRVANTLGHRSSDLDQALWRCMGIRTRVADGVLTVE